MNNSSIDLLEQLKRTEIELESIEDKHKLGEQYFTIYNLYHKISLNIIRDMSYVYGKFIELFTDIKVGDTIEVTTLPECVDMYDKNLRRMNSKKYLEGKKVIHHVKRIGVRGDKFSSKCKEFEEVCIDDIYLETTIFKDQRHCSRLLNLKDLNYKIIGTIKRHN